MNIKYLYKILLLFFSVSNTALAEYKMHFFLPNFPPYTTLDSHGNFVGIGLDKMKPILDSIGVQYTFQVGSNHGRALTELKIKRSDGFFMASRNEERDKYAVFSKSVMINRWVWVVLGSTYGTFNPSDKSKYTVASLLNTNTNTWLEKSGYQLTKPAWNIESLVEKLNTREADAVLVAEEVFLNRFKGNHNYKIILQEAKEFGVYVSKDFLKQNPEFMDKLNTAIESSTGLVEETSKMTSSTDLRFL